MDQETSSKNIIIIGGGPSIKEIPAAILYKYGYTITVNESSILVKSHVALSMDRLWMEARYKMLETLDIPVFFRRCAWKIGYEWDKLQLFDGDVHLDHLSDEENKLAGANSGMCAINLAYKMRPENLFLFGFDMKTPDNKRHINDHYWYDPAPLIKAKEEITDKKINTNQSPSKYKHWMQKFPNIAKQMEDKNIKVWNVNPSSAIEVFEKIDFEEFKCLVH